VSKIVENAIKRTTEKFTAQMQETTTRLTAAEARAAEMDRADKLIESDPDRYISILAVLHPEKYGKYVGKGAAAPAAKPVVDEDPMPSTDTEFADGSKGYSPERFQEVLAWNRRQGARDAQAEMDKAYGPIKESFAKQEEKRKAQEAVDQQLPAVRSRVERASKRWGKLFDDDYKLDTKSEVLAYLDSHPGESFEEACAGVFLPKMVADQNKVRAGFADELNSRSAAASPGPAAANKGSGAGPQDMDSIILGAIASAGLR
jgi:hypothetical protein